jgi:hypothetical protein
MVVQVVSQMIERPNRADSFRHAGQFALGAAVTRPVRSALNQKTLPR